MKWPFFNYFIERKYKLLPPLIRLLIFKSDFTNLNNPIQKPFTQLYFPGKIPLITILLMTCWGTLAQPVPTSLEEVRQSAVQKSPLIEKAQLQLSLQKNLKNQIYDPGNLSVVWSYGQINSALMDYGISFSQSVGNIPKAIAEQKSQNAVIDLSQQELVLQIRELLFEVTDAYLSWIYHTNQLQNLRQQVLLLQKLQVADSKGTNNVIELELEGLELQLIHASIDHNEALGQILQLSGMDSLVAPQEWPIMEMSPDSSLSPVFLTVLDKKQLILDHNIAAERLGYFPSFNVGYFNQELDHVTGFQGFTVGASLPLWSRPQNARVQEQKIIKEMVLVDQNQQIAKLQQDFKGVSSNLRAIKRLKTRQRSMALADMQRLEESKPDLEQGRIGLDEYLEQTGLTYESYRSRSEIEYLYLKFLNQYNFYTER